MSKLMHDSIKHIGLQFFAEGDNGGKNDPPPADPSAGNGDNGNQSQNPEGSKSYTQEQLNSMMAREKRTARQAILKELGFDPKSEKDFTDTLSEIKKTLDSGKTQQQLDKEAKKAAEDKLAEAESKNAKLELKVAALAVGAKPEALDDIITLALSKMGDGNPSDKVLKELKEKYPTLFGESAGSSGTGNPNNPPRNKGGNSGDGLGKRLAKSNKSTQKSSYFKNN